MPVGMKPVGGDTLMASYASTHLVDKYDRDRGVIEKQQERYWLLTRIAFVGMLWSGWMGYAVALICERKKWQIPDWVC